MGLDTASSSCRSWAGLSLTSLGLSFIFCKMRPTLVMTLQGFGEHDLGRGRSSRGLLHGTWLDACQRGCDINDCEIFHTPPPLEGRGLGPLLHPAVWLDPRGWVRRGHTASVWLLRLGGSLLEGSHHVGREPRLQREPSKGATRGPAETSLQAI